MDHIHKSVNNFKGSGKLLLWGIISLALVIGFFVWAMVQTGDSNSDDNDDDDGVSKSLIIVVGIVGYIGGLGLIIYCMITKLMALT
jgi:hypothetical protein